ncbi:BrnT family toxin [Psychromarinibacter sp. C21-152]|uniref:BrnT family toxin n=1 Tax=Psychromarinibacter sediminicola TaxID=3033385 RepID=A0AAE3TBC2_9RHOB|nr:BrnT family toxin [Psychromarinibacter sediminicola]MDF0602530.1 BrnT family toxin [Psychromarinibacter sediminicola]
MASNFEWDESKNRQNVELRGIDFSVAEGFDWSTAQLFADDRIDYGEDRVIARGTIGDRLHILVFVLRGSRMRIISLRKANRRERRAYVAETGRPLRDT